MQHAQFEKPHSARPIEVDFHGEPKGVLVSLDEGYRFLAVKLDVFDIDGRIFDSLEDAQAAIRDTLARQ